MNTLFIALGCLVFVLICWACVRIALLEKTPHIEDTDRSADDRVSSIRAHLRPDDATEVRESDFAELHEDRKNFKETK